ncbi:MAG: autotransporter assembly complex family protein [Pseudomonadota bacterium]
MLTPIPAQALELFGFCLLGECKQAQAAEEARFIDPKRYDVQFTVNGEGLENADGLDTLLKSASALYAGRNKPVGGSAGLISRAKGDYRRLLAALYNGGRYGVSVSITVNGAEAANLNPGTQLPATSQVAVSVSPGPQYRFGTADVTNPAPPPVDPGDVTKSFEEIGYIDGAPARATVVRQAGKLAVLQWQQQGHALAKVEGREARALHPQEQLNVTLRMNPGPKAYYGDVTVSGTERMDPAFVAYMAGLVPGEEYDPDTLKRAQERLDRLGVFSTRKLEAADNLNSNGLLPFDLVVSERKLRKIGIGATVSSVDGAGVEAYWLHRNLFGKAERLRLDAKFGGIGTSDALDEFDYALGGTLTQPGFFSPDTDLVSNIFAKREFNETFLETSAGGSIGVTHYLSKSTTLKGSFFGEVAEFEDAFGKRQFVTFGADGEAELDFRNSKVDPTTGTYFKANARPFYEGEFGNAALRMETEARAYLALGEENRTVLAGRVKLGALLGPSIAQTPPDQLFLTGGGNSVRGYAFKSIGIAQTNTNGGEDVAGGRSLLEGSLELRQRFTENLGAVAFVDAGLVESNSFVNLNEDLRVSVGLGLRYYTGLGPIRLDVAIPLDPGPDDPDFAVYAGIGQAF